MEEKIMGYDHQRIKSNAKLFYKNNMAIRY